MKTSIRLAAALLALLAAGVAWAASTGTGTPDQLNIVCSNEPDWCDLMVGAFTEQTGVKVTMVRKSTGETLAQVRAQAANPQIDVWWGGTGDPHLIAAAEGLTQPSGIDTSQLLGWAQKMSDISGGRTIGVHLGVLGVAYNPDLLAERGLTPPACWKDLADPIYAGEIMAADPNTSGTAYTELATLVQVFGEDEAFKLLAAIGKNVRQYTRSGSAPTKALTRGETAISIGFEHDMVKFALAGFPVVVVSPCEGTGYEVGGLSIIAGTRHLEAARKFAAFAISAKAQSLGPQVGVYNVPSNFYAVLPPEAPDPTSIKLIDYDFATFGTTETRKRLLARWVAEVKNAD